MPSDLLATLQTARETVEERHGWWSGGKAKGAFRKWRFGEGCDEAWSKKGQNLLSTVVGGSWTRNRKKERYLSLNASTLDAGLHEFVRSAARHYWRAKGGMASVRQAPVKPKTSAGSTPLQGAPLWLGESELVKAYALFHHDLGKARVYLNACTQLSLVCYQKMGLATGGETNREPLLARVRTALPGLAEALDSAAFAGQRAINPEILKETEALVGLLEQWWARAQAANGTVPGDLPAPNPAHCDPASASDVTRVVGPQRARWIADEFAKQLAELRDPAKVRQVWHHYKRAIQEADRQEKAKVGIGVAVAAGTAVAPLVGLTVGVTVAVIGALPPLKLSLEKPLKPLLQLLARVVPGADLASLGSVAPAPSLALSLEVRDENGAADAAPVDDDGIKSAGAFVQHELQSLAKQIDELIIKAARHLQEAEQHLDALDALNAANPETRAAPSLLSVVGAQPDQEAEEAGGAGEDADVAAVGNVGAVGDVGSDLTVTAEQAVLYYEYAHDIEKTLSYLKLVTIFECSLEMALRELEGDDGQALFAYVMRGLNGQMGEENGR